MDYLQLPEFIEDMKEKVNENISDYQTDAMLDLSIIVQSMNENSLPNEAYWITRDAGTHLGFADERMATSDVYGYVQQNENSILNAVHNEHCYKMDFTNGTIEQIEPQKFIEKVNEYGMPPKEIISEKALSSPEVYLKGINYAKENNEIDLYHESEKLNKECGKAITENIKANTEHLEYGQRVNVEQALFHTLEQNHSIDRIAFVAASTVYNSLHDGRYQKATKEWAKEQFEELPKNVCEDSYKNGIQDTCHPTIFNDFAEKVINEQERIEKIKDLPALNDIISVTDDDTMKIDQAYVTNLSENDITIAFSPQEINLLYECTYTGTGVDTYTFEEFKVFDINKNDSLSDKEREEIIEKIDIDISVYADNKALATVILNAVDMLEEISGLSKEEIYDETYQHGGVGEHLSDGKVYNFSDEMLNNIAYNTFIMLEENGYSKEEIIKETGISDSLYNRMNGEQEPLSAKENQESKTKVPDKSKKKSEDFER